MCKLNAIGSVLHVKNEKQHRNTIKIVHCKLYKDMYQYGPLLFEVDWVKKTKQPILPSIMKV